MSNMNKVLTNVSQALSDDEKTTARNNINAMKRSPTDNTEYVLYNGGYKALSKDVFVCEENVTTLSQILNAINDRKQLLVVRSGSYANQGPSPASVAYKTSTQVELFVMLDKVGSVKFIITSSGWQFENYQYFNRCSLNYGISSISTVRDATINLHSSFKSVIVTQVPGYNESSEVFAYNFCRVIVLSADDSDATNYKMYCTAQKVSGELHMLEIYVNKTTSAWSIASDKVFEIPDLKEASSLSFEDALDLAKKGVPITNGVRIYTPVYYQDSLASFINLEGVGNSHVRAIDYLEGEEGFSEDDYTLSLYIENVNSNVTGADDSLIELVTDSFNYVEDGFNGAADSDGTITIKLDRLNGWAFENIVDILGVEGLKRIKIVSNEYGDDENDYVGEIEVTKVNFNLFTPGYLYRVNIFGYSATITEIPRYEESVTIGDKKYPVVTVGSTKWIAENLDLTWDGLSVGETGTISETTPCAWYYRNNEEAYGKNGRKCGLLYNINALNYLIANKSTLLPDGWDVASMSDFTSAINSDVAGGSVYALIKDTDWDSAESVGTNKTRISIVQAGERGTSDSFSSIGVKTSIWTQDDSSTSIGDKIFVQLENGERHDHHTKDVSNGFSIRLVQRDSSDSSNTIENPPEKELP